MTTPSARSSLALLASSTMHAALAATVLFAVPVWDALDASPGASPDNVVIQLRGDQSTRAAGRDRLWEVLAAADGINVRLTSPHGDRTVGLAFWSPTRGLWLAIDEASGYADQTLQVWRLNADGLRTAVADIGLDKTGSGRVVVSWSAPHLVNPTDTLTLEVTGRTGWWPLARVAPVIIGTSELRYAPQAPRVVPLTTADGLIPTNVTATPATLDGKAGVRVVTAPEIQKLTLNPPSATATAANEPLEQFALVDGLTFGNGTIELEVAGVADTSVFKDARGFVGLAFRVQPDLKTYDAFYLRPTNGRADDHVRRNHSAQYISHPAWPWFRLREETPERYESYVDLVPGAWTRMKIEVQGTRGLLYVHGQSQPTLIINDLKTGPTARGGVALWIDVGTQAHFRNLVVTSSN